MPKSTRAKTEEDEFLDDYMNWLDAAGYDLRFHVIGTKKPAKVTSRGWPDVFASHPVRGVLVAELKATKRYPTRPQVTWLTRLARQLPPPPDETAQSRVHLWRPADRLKALTQMGTPENAPVHCDCRICRSISGQPIRQRRSRQTSANQLTCPRCGQPMTAQQMLNRGVCDNCRTINPGDYEARLIAERAIERVY